MQNLDWLKNEISEIDPDYIAQAQDRQNSLTKPPGSLGQLEELAIQLSAMQKSINPKIKNINIVVFAADHGIAAENVSAFPQAVTAEMVRNFSRGGAAISVLAKQLQAELEVVNVGTVAEIESLHGVIDQRIDAGTKNFYTQKAMTNNQLIEALQVARDAVNRAIKKSADLFIAGDMGIANTTSATAIASVLLNEPAVKLTGPGTGLNAQGVKHKASVIQESIERHKDNMQSTTDVLQCLGGFEIVALVGAYIACAQSALPVVVDGFISSVAALAAIKINPQVKNWMFFSHASAEPGHKIIMQSLQTKPLLDMNMRLGEASGAAVVVPLMQLACELQNNMATFEQAGVSNKDAES